MTFPDKTSYSHG